MGSMHNVVRWGVGRRLVALVLVPLIVLTFVLSRQALDRQDSADAAADVLTSVQDLRRLVDLQSSLYGERAAGELVIRAAQLGVPADVAYEMLGLDPVELAENVSQSDVFLQAVPWLELDEALLAAARSGVTAGDDSAIDAFDRLDQTIVDALLASIATMSTEAVATEDPLVDRTLRALADSVVAFSAGADQVSQLSGTWFSAGDRQLQAQTQLGLATARYDLAIERLASLDLAGLALDASATEVPEDSAFTSTLAAGLRGDLSVADALLNIDEVGEAFNIGLARNVALSELVDAAATRAETQASRVADDARRDFVAAASAGAGVIVLSLALSLWLARSIGRPLKELTGRMRELGAGRIDGEPLQTSGPPELAEAAEAVNDVVANLRLLERKVSALASCDFEDEALLVPLAGELGRSLAESVTVLSGSIMDRAELQERLAHEASHDSLTGLANRPAALERLRDALARGRRHRKGVALLFLDLDSFKRSNDLFGHQTGDQVLIEVGKRIRRSVRGIDLAARLGGDEFVVVLEEVDGLDAAKRLAERIRRDLCRPILLRDAEVGIGASIGIAFTASGEVDALELLTAADLALYRAKHDDQHIVVFDEDLRAEVEQRSQIERRLRSALESGRGLEIHYQPLIDARTGEVRGFEALTRWYAPEPVSPSVFVPIAERSDLIIDLDQWVLRTALATAARWADAPGAADLQLSINVSGRHLVHAAFVTNVLDALERSGMPPDRLIIEVTETALVIDQVRAAAHLETLREHGVAVAVDDFGTGFTSISQLRELPVDELKLDRSLVMSLPDGTDREMVRMVMELADHLGIPTVAEGVETPAQAAFLRGLGCDLLQGWLYAQAMPADEVVTWHHDWSRRIEFGPTPDGFDIAEILVGRSQR